MDKEWLKVFSWNAIETVLLDMDGTLLDKYFDDYFWEHLMPEEYAKKYNLNISEAKHLIAVHPNLEDFLQFLRKENKGIYLVTNAHYKTLDIKLKKTEIGKYFDSVICAFDIGLPKEESAFWGKLAGLLNFRKENTMLIDDNEDVLLSARDYGIKYLILKARPSSRGGIRTSENFTS